MNIEKLKTDQESKPNKKITWSRHYFESSESVEWTIKHTVNGYVFTIGTAISLCELIQNPSLAAFRLRQTKKKLISQTQEFLMDNQKKLYAIYSAKQAEIAGVLEYLTPENKAILVTAVSPTPGCPEYLFDDKDYLGEVTEYVRRISDESTFSVKMPFYYEN